MSTATKPKPGDPGDLLAHWLAAHREKATSKGDAAGKLGISAGRLSQLLNSFDDFPPSQALAIRIHVFTDGAVPANVLRPDMWRRPEDVPLPASSEGVAP